jgi:hypothetical protein
MQEFGVKPEPVEEKMQFPGPPPVDQNTFQYPAPPELHTIKQEDVKPAVRRNRWGPPMTPATSSAPAPAPTPAPETTPAETEPEGEGKKKKRRSRWETSTETAVGQLLPTFPKELMLPGGIKVRQ